jgi:predicted RNA-binding protein with TRAM domain
MSYINRGNRYGSGGRGPSGFTERRQGRFEDRRSEGPRPVEAGKEYTVEVIELSRRGDGVAKIEGFVIFVKGAKVGDKVRIKVDSVGPRFATASIVENAPTSAAPEASSSGTPSIAEKVDSPTQ